MKKKVRDLTLGEIAEICENSENCKNCPLYEYCPKRYITPNGMAEDLDKEIEL